MMDKNQILDIWGTTNAMIEEETYDIATGLKDEVFGSCNDEEEPYYIINGQKLRIGTDASTKSELNVVKTPMFVASKYLGYNHLQWTQFSGEEVNLKVYSRPDELYTGDPTQPEEGEGDATFYEANVNISAVLKYWAQFFVPCEVVTNIPTFQDGTFVITEFSQEAPEPNFIVTTLTLTQYEEPDNMAQGYDTVEGETVMVNDANTSELTAFTNSVDSIGTMSQTTTNIDGTNVADGTTTLLNEDGSVYTDGTSTYVVDDSGGVVELSENDVMMLQYSLNMMGYYSTSLNDTTNGNPVTGVYDENTTDAIKQFQEANGLVVNGNFDVATRDQLSEAMSF